MARRAPKPRPAQSEAPPAAEPTATPVAEPSPTPPVDEAPAAGIPAAAAPQAASPPPTAPAPAATIPPSTAPPPAAAQPSAAGPRADTGSIAVRLLTTPRPVRDSTNPVDLVGPLALTGVALIVGGSLAPFFSAAGTSISSWDLPAGFLFSDTATPSSFKLGVILLSALLALIPLLTRRPLTPIILLLIAAPAANAAVNIYMRKLRTDTYPDLGYGLALIMAGAALVAAEALRPCWRAMREMAQ